VILTTHANWLVPGEAHAPLGLSTFFLAVPGCCGLSADAAGSTWASYACYNLLLGLHYIMTECVLFGLDMRLHPIDLG
jgi:hypothetical protein